MAGMTDGVSKLWITRADKGLSVYGYGNELEAIDALIRAALTKSKDVPAIKSAVMARVDDALKHMDESQTLGCNLHADCAEANKAAQLNGKPWANHCHDDCCEDCFGS